MKHSVKSVLAVGLLVFCASAGATPVPVSFSTTSVGPLYFYADTFRESGLSGILALDTASGVTTTGQVNFATMTVGNSGATNDSQSISLNFDLTLDGVTHTLSQSAIWSITPSQDRMLAFDASSDVLFQTALGSWLVHLNAFTITATAMGNFSSAVTADFKAVPEPGTLGLLGLGLAGLGFARRRKTA